MDDARIKALTAEVLAQLASGPSGPETGGNLESKVATLEAAVRGLQGAQAPPATAIAVAVAVAHPSQALLAVPGAGSSGMCCMEPDKPCVDSGACRTFGH